MSDASTASHNDTRGPLADTPPPVVAQALLAGRQALVRLPILQRALDRQQGLNTAGYISGYRGSPLGGYDAALWQAAAELQTHDIVFHPGLNEDLALTAVAGTQQIDFVPGRTVDGVFGLWYGKGPGVDRSGDAIKHANLAGTAPTGGVVLIFGDDHAGKSSTTAHQSDLTLASWGVPILYPASVADVLRLGLAAIAMSRFSGTLVGLKLVNETAESTGAVDLALPEFICPDVLLPAGGVHIRREYLAMQQQEQRLLRHKLPRAQAFARANRLDAIAHGAITPRFAIATAGKAYADVLDGLGMLGLDDAACRRAGIGVYKIALLFPLEPEAFCAAMADAAEIMFVEEKQAHLEPQAKQLLFNRAARPAISGKATPDGTALLPGDLPLSGRNVAEAIAARLAVVLPGVAVTFLAPTRQAIGGPLAVRRPAFCPGCPHSASTRVPEGSVGATGIGCHGMAVFHPERNPLPMGQMGAEGANWIGLSQFSATDHIFQNLGDGTYNHSGSLAIRAAVQAGVNVTFKILFNDAVAMTGGQPVEGALTVSRIARQVAAEGVRRVVVLSEDAARFANEPLPPGTVLRHRDELDATQQELRGVPGVTVLIYDQVCAAEKRRRRKAGTYPAPDVRLFINPLVCEGCGDCSVQSNCLAIAPNETELGLKRRIDQSACNKDFSCQKGFCPSFVTVIGSTPKGAGLRTDSAASLPEPDLPPLGETFDLVIAGIGGTGVVTIGVILGTAAKIAGLGVNLFDMTGLSQKGGAVFSHVRFSRDRQATLAAKVGPGGAGLVIACDLVAATQADCLETMSPRTLIVGNGDVAATAAFQSHRDAVPPVAALIDALGHAGGRAPHLLPATRLAEEMFGNALAANMLLLGQAWQLGGIPVARAAIEQAIRKNGKGAETNLRAFAAGRAAALAPPAAPEDPPGIDGFVAARAEDLRHYWNAAYASRYTALVAATQAAAGRLAQGDALVWAVARAAYRLMAYKDEYEVARLYSDGRFRAALMREFGSVRALRVQLAPPLLARRDRLTGRPRKIAVGGWIFPLFRGLAALKGLREGPFDVFGRTAERRLERALRETFIQVISDRLPGLVAADLADMADLANAVLEVRGYGHVKHPAATQMLKRLRAANAAHATSRSAR